MLSNVSDSIQSLRWAENITLKNIEQFQQEMERLINSHVDSLILNLANTDYINSAGLGVIANSVLEARKKQKELIIVEIHQSVQEIFSIVKFTAFIKSFESETSAIDYFSGSNNGNQE